MTLQDAASRLQGAKPKQYKFGPGFIAKCPCCESTSPHLAIWEKEDWWHVRCQKDHTESEIVAAMGLQDDDRRIKVARSDNQETTYVYTDAKGAYVFEKVRFLTLNGKKSFFQRVVELNGKPVQKVKNKYGKLHWPTPAEAGLNGECKVLYRLPNILKAIADGKTIYIGEGEKAADCMWSKGMAGTCQSDGAGNNKWRPEHTFYLNEAKEVVIVADRDPDGEAYATQVWTALNNEGVHCRVVRSKTTNAKDDAYDHLIAGYGAEDFEPAPELMREVSRTDLLTRLGAKCLAGVAPTEVSWLWYPYIPKGRCTILDGDGDTGKTYMCCAIATGLTNGILPNGMPTGDERRNVLLLMSEDDDDDTIVPRILSLGGNMDHVFHMKALFPFDEAGFARLREVCEIVKPIFIVIDPVLAYLGATVNINQANEVRPVFDKLKNIIREFNSGAVNIRHEGKSNEGRAKHHAGLGSVDIRNIHRSQLTVEWHKDVKGLRVIRHPKHNYSEEGDAFGYEFRDGQFMWRWDIPDESPTQASNGKMQEAIKFLRQILTGQFVPVKMVIAQAKELGISERTIERARKELAGTIESMKAGPDAGYLLHIKSEAVAYDPWADE